MVGLAGCGTQAGRQERWPTVRDFEQIKRTRGRKDVINSVEETPPEKSLV